MDLREIGFENEKWIELAGCGIEWYCTVLYCTVWLGCLGRLAIQFCVVYRR